ENMKLLLERAGLPLLSFSPLTDRYGRSEGAMLIYNARSVKSPTPQVIKIPNCAIGGGYVTALVTINMTRQKGGQIASEEPLTQNQGGKTCSLRIGIGK